MKREIGKECEGSSAHNKNRTAEQLNLGACIDGGRRGWCSDVTLVRAPPAMTWRVKMNPPLQGCRGSSRLSSEYLTSSSHSGHTHTHASSHSLTHTCTAARPALGTYKISVPMFPLKSETQGGKKTDKERWKTQDDTDSTDTVGHREVKEAFWLLLSFEHSMLLLLSISVSLSLSLTQAEAVLIAEAADALGSLQSSMEPPSRMAGPGTRYWLSLCQSDTRGEETVVEVGGNRRGFQAALTIWKPK